VTITYGQQQPQGTGMIHGILRKLHDLAFAGEIMIMVEELEKAVFDGTSKITKKQSAEFGQALQEADEKELLIITKRQFGSKPLQKFVSLKLKNISIESVMWILKSLEKDEMTPVERAIQSRFKESFGLKLNSAEWSKVLEAVKTPKSIAKDPKDPDYEFDIMEIDDSVSGSRTCSIYPKGKFLI
jgi:hypothetical protein